MSEIKEYSEEYKEKCKTSWYAGGRPNNYEHIHSLIPEDEYGRKPLIRTLRAWRKDMMWDFWADDLDSKALTVRDNDLIIQKADMLKRHAEMAHSLQTQAMDYLTEEGFDTSASAVNAIIRGAELERTSRGIGEMMVRMATMNDAELKDEIMKAIARASENNQFPTDVIDSDSIPEKEEKEDDTSD